MFGFLRRLLMAGDIKGVLEGSRRALRELSPALGERGVPTAADEFVVNATRGTGRPANLTPQDTWDARYLERGDQFTTESPFGGRVEVFPDGRRVRQAPNMYSGMASPYDRFTPLPPGSRMTTREQEAFKQRLLARRPQSYMTDPADAYMERFDYGDPFYNPADSPYIENWQGVPGDMYRYSTPEDNFLQNIFNRRIGDGRPVPPWAHNVEVESADEYGIFPAQTYQQARRNPAAFIPPPPPPPYPGPPYQWDRYSNSWQIPF